MDRILTTNLAHYQKRVRLWRMDKEHKEQVDFINECWKLCAIIPEEFKFQETIEETHPVVSRNQKMLYEKFKIAIKSVFCC